MNDIKSGSIAISGLSDLEKVLNDFPDKLAKNILIGGVRAGANIIRTEARYLSPVADKAIIKKFDGENITIQPGFLKKNIASWKTRHTPYAVTFSIGVAGWKDRADKFFAFYWRFLEFGTKTIGRGRSNKTVLEKYLNAVQAAEHGTSHIGATPFLRAAFEGRKTQAVEAMRDYMDKRIDKEAPKQVNT
jgi:HK97 gp10 family phage protein